MMKRSLIAVTAALVVAGLALSSLKVAAQSVKRAGELERPQSRAGEVSPLRPVHTYSIVARDPKTGELGVAVQSHWFSVGTVVAWAEAGVGAIATQSFVDPSYGRSGLEAMRGGRGAEETLKALLAADDDERRRLSPADVAARSFGRVERGEHAFGQIALRRLEGARHRGPHALVCHEVGLH